MKHMKRRVRELSGMIDHLENMQGHSMRSRMSKGEENHPPDYLKKMDREEPSPGENKRAPNRSQNVRDSRDLEPVEGANRRANNRNENIKGMKEDELSPSENRRANNRNENIRDLSHEELTSREGSRQKERYKMDDDMKEPESEMEEHLDSDIREHGKPETDKYGNETVQERLGVGKTDLKEVSADDDLDDDVNDVSKPKIPRTEGANGDEEMSDDELEELLRRHLKK